MTSKSFVGSTFLLLLSTFFFLLFSTIYVDSYNLLLTDDLEDYDQLSLSTVVGPESLAFDCNGRGPYVGVADGRVMKWQSKHLRWKEFAITSPNRTSAACDGSVNPDMEPTCGRPLGLKFDTTTCDLYIADAYYGLLKVGPRGGLSNQLAAEAEGVPFRLTNALEIDTDSGVVYFTDSSTKYQRREYMKVFENADYTGRILKYDPRSNKVTVLLNGLSFPNGLALSKDKSFLVVAITGEFRILKYWLQGPKANTAEPFAQVSRFTDNIKSNDDGDFWMEFNSARGNIPTNSGVQDGNGDDDVPWFTKDPVAVKYRADGSVAEVLDGMYGDRFEAVSEILEFKGTLWVGSLVKPFVGKFKNI